MVKMIKLGRRLLVLFGITVARRTGCSLLAKYSSVAFHLLALLLAESKQGDENIHGLYVMKLMRSFCISSSEKREKCRKEASAGP
ncbi:uncharacterized protein LOC142525023 isoform X3 [Primulina tabacum]|uniref:uncharacterized protein LOC142525023 isoform X3 n=1 Tax=Primulina tabacum TaxID=48773 RepID=UPI003F5A6CC9